VPDIVNPQDLDKKQIFLIMASPANIRQRNIDLIKEISTNGFHIIVVTINFPYNILLKLYQQDGIDTKSVSFVDAVTRNSIGSANDIPGVVRFVNNPGNLTDLGISVMEVLKEHSGNKVCVLYDSISTMLIYLSSQDITKFIHFVTNKLRLQDISGIFLAVEKGLDPMLLTHLTTFVDTIIETD
jgi:hypothetical protein